tara:strand:+ start:306 stop:938 length:633 start_codon:yes stop_codon:yes gene_type:complete
MILAIPIEIKIREFLNKLYLASRILHLTKFDIIIGKKNQVYDFFKRNKNVILLSKGGVKKNFTFTEDHLKNNKILMLDEEGPIFNIGHFDQKLRASNYVLSRCAKFILWGKKDLLSNDDYRKDKNKYPTLGHPKYDLLKKPQSKIFIKECKSIKKDTKTLFLLPQTLMEEILKLTLNFITNITKIHCQKIKESKMHCLLKKYLKQIILTI